MMNALEQKKKELRKFELRYNIMKLETSMLELDEQKQKLQENINKQSEELKLLEAE